MNALLVAAAYVFTPVLFFRGLKMRSRCTYSVLRQASLAALVPESNGRGSMLRVLTPRVLQILAVVSIMFAAPIRAESGAWSSHGPFGGRVNGFAFARHTLYAATASGAWVLRGDDGSWSALGTVIYASSVAVDPINSSNLYVAGLSFARHTGFLRSSDRGVTWDNPVAGLPFNYYNTVVVNPVNPSNVFVAGVTGVYRSSDGGVNWQGVAGIPTTEYIASIAVDPLAPATVFAAGTGGVYRSVDGGSNWVQLSGGIPLGSYSNSLAIDAKPASVAIYAVINGAVYRSVDSGNSWTPLAPIGPTEFALTVTIGSSPKSSSSLFALAFDWSSGATSVFKSLDAGASWAPVGPSHPPNDPLLGFAVDPARQSTLYAGAYQSGVSASFDGGANWATLGHHLVGMIMSRVAVAPSAPKTVYVGSSHGIFVSTDQGKTWAGLGADAGGTSQVSALTVSPAAATTAYAGTGSGALITVDGGATWSPMNSGLPLIDGFNPPAVTALVVDPATPNTIYTGTDGVGIYKTTDGHNWTPASNGLAGENVYSLAINPKDPNTLYASTYDGTEGPPDSRVGIGVFKSTDGGAHWTSVSAGLTNMLIRTLAVDPANPTTLYAGCNRDGIFKSVNGAATWTLSNNGVGSYPSNIVVDPANSTVYTSTYDAGVFQSNDFGNTWNPINRGLDVPSASLQWLALDPTSHRLFIATFMRGVASMVIDRNGD